jgi:hypothetical protein
MAVAKHDDACLRRREWIAGRMRLVCTCGLSDQAVLDALADTALVRDAQAAARG